MDQAGEHDVRAGGLHVAALTLVGRRRPLLLGHTDSSCRPAEKNAAARNTAPGTLRRAVT